MSPATLPSGRGAVPVTVPPRERVHALSPRTIRDDTEETSERPHRHHGDVPPDDLRAGGGGDRPPPRPHRRAAAPERPDGEPDGRPDGARRPADRRGRPTPATYRVRAAAGHRGDALVPAHGRYE